ncbi:glycosyltransferase family 4 protein [Mitsuaria sp. WAJ17]|uniref:glycosyltransferase family 4 protein n=1 Tax=Mitsuaria sp. WAJ17 TaxID=2761452 RepID=UPI001604645A|nr:glycosyltransferase family 1 protein [Mitsuaria sp. WAJ17]MBB2484229.1 glycosyltransferase family 4 protein [Mitsuaria sp. WAJ17]
MRPVVINGKFLAQRVTGVQRVAHELVRALDQELGRRPAAERPSVLLLHPDSGTAPALDHISCRASPAPLGRLHLWEQWTLPRAAKGGLLLNLAGSAPALGRRQICMLHDAAVFDWPRAYTRAFVAWYRFLFRRLAGRARKILTPSAFSQSRLQVHLPALRTRPGSDCQVLPLAAEHMDRIAADSAWLHETGLAQRPFLLAVASENPSKNLSGLLQAFAQWPGRSGHLLVLAGGSNPEVFRPDGPQVADEANVRRLGPVSDAQLKALYGAAKAFVQPSWYEGFGLPPLEAMRCGCPVLSANQASLPEVCGEAAAYFDPHRDPSDPQGFSAALERLLADPAAATKSRARAAQFSWAASGRQLLDLLLSESQAGD